MFKLAINAGHFSGTSRGVPASMSPQNHPNEWWLNDRIVDKVETMLCEYDGITVLRIDDTNGKKEMSLSERTDKANAFDADLYLAVHHNGGINGGTGGGIMAFVYTAPSETELSWQKAFYEALIEKTGLKGDRATPMARQNLHEVREPQMPAVLLELGFMDSVTDVPVILTDQFAVQCAQAIVQVIVRKAGLTKKTTGFASGEVSLGVYTLKRLLAVAKALSLVPRGVADDGGFGDGTRANVLAVQAASGLPQTGIADEATVRALYRQIESALTALDAPASDVNGDGQVNLKDVLALRSEIADAGDGVKHPSLWKRLFGGKG